MTIVNRLFYATHRCLVWKLYYFNDPFKKTAWLISVFGIELWFWLFKPSQFVTILKSVRKKARNVFLEIFHIKITVTFKPSEINMGGV